MVPDPLPVIVRVTAPELFGLLVGLLVPLNESVTATFGGVTVTEIWPVSPVDILNWLGDWLSPVTLSAAEPVLG
jgi:hypothetical protein